LLLPLLLCLRRLSLPLLLWLLCLLWLRLPLLLCLLLRQRLLYQLLDYLRHWPLPRLLRLLLRLLHLRLRLLPLLLEQHVQQLLLPICSRLTRILCLQGWRRQQGRVQ